MFAAAVWKLLKGKSQVFHDKKIRGQFSQSLYQIDVLAQDQDSTVMGEAKDYTERDAKVGRDDLQKLGGALGDLSVSKGAFFSATDYTKPARLYAQSSEDINQKSINLYHLRPSSSDDEKGRIKSIHIDMHLITPDFDNAKYTVAFTKDGTQMVKDFRSEREPTQQRMDKIYHSDGTVYITVPELTSNIGGDYKRAYGSFWLPKGYLKIDDSMIPIKGITYDIPLTDTVEKLVITADGEAKLLVQAEDGSINKLITDEDLKKVSFDENNEAIFES